MFFSDKVKVCGGVQKRKTLPSRSPDKVGLHRGVQKRIYRRISYRVGVGALDDPLRKGGDLRYREVVFRIAHRGDRRSSPAMKRG